MSFCSSLFFDPFAVSCMPQVFTKWSVGIERNHYKYSLNINKNNNKNNRLLINCIFRYEMHIFMMLSVELGKWHFGSVVILSNASFVEKSSSLGIKDQKCTCNDFYFHIWIY
jgi:hypothetical protein